MASTFAFLPMVVVQQAGPQSLARLPEPAQVTDAANRVAQYNLVMSTKLVLGYTAGLEIIHRIRPELRCDSAIDLCCGPGHFTLCITRYFTYKSVLGIDLSSPMVDIAASNAAAEGLQKIATFRVGNATQLDEIPSAEFDLAGFTDAAHHMPDLDTVRAVLRQMDRVTKPSGIVMAMDLVRLRTAKLTERYLEVLGGDYQDRGLGEFFDDFRNSMYAVWTPKELHSAIPTDSARWWCHLVPRGLPTIQFIVGLPVGRNRLFLRRGFAAEQHPLIMDWYPRWRDEVSPTWANQTLQEWKLARMTLITAHKHFVPPGK